MWAQMELISFEAVFDTAYDVIKEFTMFRKFKCNLRVMDGLLCHLPSEENCLRSNGVYIDAIILNT